MDFAVEIDPEADAAYVRASQAPVFRSEEIADGLILDVDLDGQIVGIEVLGVKSRVGHGDARSFLEGLATGLMARGAQVAAE